MRQRRQERAEDDEQQDHDEQDGQVLAQVDRSLGGLAGVGLGGHLTGQVGVQGAGLDGVAEARDEMVGGALGAEVDVGEDLQLNRLTVSAGGEACGSSPGSQPALGWCRWWWRCPSSKVRTTFSR